MIKMFSKVLNKKDLPYLFILLVAAIGFLVSKIYENTNDMPILKYSVTKKNETNVYIFKNLARTKRLTDVEIILSEKSGNIKNINVYYVPPAVEPNVPKPPNHASPQRWNIFIGDFNPSDVVMVTVTTMPHSDQVEIRLSTKEPTILMTAGSLTFFLENEINILLVLILFLLLVAIAYVTYISLVSEERKAQK